MNKSLNVFLSVLLCVVLCVGVLTSLYTTDDSSVSQPQYEYSTSPSTGVGAPAISFGTGASGDGLAVPMSSSRRSSREQYLQPSWRSTGVADLQGFSRSANSTGMLSLPSLQGGDGGRLLTYMSSSQKATSFGGGSNTAGVSMSGGVVSATTQSPIANNQLSDFNLPSPLLASQQMYTDDASMLVIYEEMSAQRGLSGRREVPSIGGGAEEASSFMEILINICGGTADLTLTDAELRTKWQVYYFTHGNAPDYWPAFLKWYQSIRTLPGTPVGGIMPLLVMLLLYVACQSINRLMLCKSRK